jgi:hypothetical protein
MTGPSFSASAGLALRQLPGGMIEGKGANGFRFCRQPTRRDREEIAERERLSTTEMRRPLRAMG